LEANKPNKTAHSILLVGFIMERTAKVIIITITPPHSTPTHKHAGLVSVAHKALEIWGKAL
jgi:hypothetical protein